MVKKDDGSAQEEAMQEANEGHIIAKIQSDIMNTKNNNATTTNMTTKHSSSFFLAQLKAFVFQFCLSSSLHIEIQDKSSGLVLLLHMIAPLHPRMQHEHELWSPVPGHKQQFL